MVSEKFGDIYAKIENYGIIPEIKINEADKAVPLAEALALGGLNIAEIISETDCAVKAMKKISAVFPDMLLLSGNIFTLDQLISAVDSGAKAIILPELNENLIGYCINNNIAVIPACSCAGDIEKALAFGIDVVKFIPSEADVGLDMLKELSAAYPNVGFIPSGAIINEDNFIDYLLNKSVIACGLPFPAEEEFIRKNEFDRIRDLATQAVQKMLGFDLAHVVINCENAEQAERDSSKIESLFGLKKTDAGASIANADILHFMKSRSYGKNGQIAICSNFIDRAVFYLKESRKEFIDESARFDGEGNLTSVFLDNIIGGFAIKLVRK